MQITYAGWQATANTNRKAGELAPREAQHLLCLASGMTHKQIAREFGVSPSTVRHSLTRIYQRLDVERGTAAIAAAVRRGWIAPLMLAIAVSALTPDMHMQRVRQPRTRVQITKQMRREESALIGGGIAA